MTSRRRSAFTVVLLAGTTWILLDACGGRTVLDGPRLDEDGGPTGPAAAGGGPNIGPGPVSGPGTSSTTSGFTTGGFTGTSSVSTTSVTSGAGGFGTTTTTTTGAGGFATGSSGVSGVGGMGGASGFAGGKGIGGAAGKAGSSGFGGSMGKAGAGGASGCSKAGCAIACAPGYIPVMQPGACCPVCVPACTGTCGPIMCPYGTHVETPPGNCCPICVQDGPTCAQGEMAYTAFRSQLLEKYSSVGCTGDFECTLAYESNRCASNCGTPLATSVASFYSDNLRSFADMNCAACPPPPLPPCPYIPPRCLMGHCTSGGPFPPQ